MLVSVKLPMIIIKWIKGIWSKVRNYLLFKVCYNIEGKWILFLFLCSQVF
jgi:hypothetical protein